MPVSARGIASVWAVGLIGAAAPVGHGAHAQTTEDLQQMSIAELANINVSSVTKTNEQLSRAPAAIYVITHDDIVRSGATTVPEMLRLAPNLQVAQTGASGNQGDQAFSDKLLVLVDGRTVYSPLFEGVYWDLQDLVPDDIDRIEVISGPGATLWGANAVNGVINIITRPASQTQGGLIELTDGAQQRSATIQFGGRVNDQLAYRLYARDFYMADTLTQTGAKAGDGWSKPQGGFRLDWNGTAGDSVSLAGDLYSGAEAQAGAPDEDVAGRNLTARWTHQGADGSSLQVQAYYDREQRGSTGSSGFFFVDMYDVDVQHSFSLGPANAIVWGAGARLSHYGINNTKTLLFEPTGGDLDLLDAFVQDSVSITHNVKLILGVKLEDDPYSHITPLPSVRASWNLDPSTLVWAAVSRAIRAPTPFDRDVIEKVGTEVFLTGNSAFQSEKLTAYEAGLRVQPTSALSFSVSTYYNVYDDLRTIEVTPASFIPLYWGNAMDGYTYGLEAWGDLRVAPWWRLSGGLNLLSDHLKFKPGASGLLGVAQAGDDPGTQAQIKSSMNLVRRVTLDADLRYVSYLPTPHVPSYVELGGRLGWDVTERVQLSLSGLNLLHDRHQEFPQPNASEAVRTVYGEFRLKF